MKLLELPDGMVSLEFQASERGGLMERLGKFGSVRRQPQARYVRISVGPEQFVYQDEWDEPSLISTSKAGAKLLRRLVASPAHSKAA